LGQGVILVGVVQHYLQEFVGKKEGRSFTGVERVGLFQQIIGRRLGERNHRTSTLSSYGKIGAPPLLESRLHWALDRFIIRQGTQTGVQVHKWLPDIHNLKLGFNQSLLFRINRFNQILVGFQKNAARNPSV
jgi:hypothetical protein